MRQLRLLSFNIQIGISTRHFGDYLTHSWKHVLPHRERNRNLREISTLLHAYDIVGLQEVDAGSLRSAFVDQTEFLAQHAGFPHSYNQINRKIGRIARHSNGLLTRPRPRSIRLHKLPGLPGRGAVVAEYPTSDDGVLAVIVLHLALGWRARRRQLDYLTCLLREYEYVVMMGDFNCGCGSRIFKETVRDTGLQGLDCSRRTFPSWHPKHNLDHILVSPNLEVIDTRVVDYALSDHLPVSATVALPGKVSIRT